MSILSSTRTGKAAFLSYKIPDFYDFIQNRLSLEYTKYTHNIDGPAVIELVFGIDVVKKNGGIDCLKIKYKYRKDLKYAFQVAYKWDVITKEIEQIKKDIHKEFDKEINQVIDLNELIKNRDNYNIRIRFGVEPAYCWLNNYSANRNNPLDIL